MRFVVFFFFKQKTAYEVRISDWSSDVCSSDLRQRLGPSAGNYDDAWAERLAPVQAIAGEPGHSRKVSYENPHLGRYISPSKHVNSQPILHCPYFTFLGLPLRSRRINAIE